MFSKNHIIVKGARVHNLKNINVNIPKDKLVVITGLSGSGKSSLAFDTIYAEGQRRYIESLSSYARQFMGVMEKPDVDSIENLPPAISIDQRSISRNPRSTVGTLTEIYDYLRVLFAKAGRPHCPKCGQKVTKQKPAEIFEQILAFARDKKDEIYILAPLIRDQKGEHKHVLAELRKAGFKEVRLDHKFYSLDEAEDLSIDKKKKHSLEVIVDQFIIEDSENIIHTLEKLTKNSSSNSSHPLYEKLMASIKKALDLGRGFILIVDSLESGGGSSHELLFSQYFVCPKCNINLPAMEPRLFSFNSPHGACVKCSGLGTKLIVDPKLLVPNSRLTLAEGALKVWLKIFANQKEYSRLLEEVASRHKFSISEPLEKIKAKQLEVLFYGEKNELDSSNGDKKLFSGVINILEQKHEETHSDYIRREIEKYMRVLPCPACEGKRLRPEALAVTFGGINISELVHKSVTEVIDFFKMITNPKSRKSIIKSEDFLSKNEAKIAKQVVKEIVARLEYLQNVGLEYLTLDRSATTISGGEAQRIRLATQIGSSLMGVVYILDEPSIGLHQRDNNCLLKILKDLRDLGNSVIVVEHDEAFMSAADHLIDIGPDAGEHGGRIVAEGTPAQVKKSSASLTGQYLGGKMKIEVPKKYRRGQNKYIVIKKASEHNLKNIDIKIPLGKFISVTGVSGSGKSTLVSDILAKALAQKFHRAKEEPGTHEGIFGLEHLDKVISIDQSPIGRTPRSNPATYTGLFNHIRDLFTEIPEAKIKGYKVGKFSFNVKDGRCEACAGEGLVKIEMQFLADVYVECEECKGKRYNPEVLEIHYQGKNIADVLEMTVEEANWFFNAKKSPMIVEKLKTLHSVGLGYLRLGQPATTLSGGEAQRVKLATELSRRATGRTLYILDEPTTGLHFADIKRLLEVLNKLVDKGNTILVIEHNLEVIKSSDWVIDLGPEGGEEGGYIVAEGTPRDVARVKKSYTGEYLKGVLK